MPILLYFQLVEAEPYTCTILSDCVLLKKVKNE